LPCLNPMNAGSKVMTSGSTYVIGWAFGHNSRGGVVIVLSGSAGLPAGGACALATTGARTVVPATAVIALMNRRREITRPMLRGSGAMPALPEPECESGATVPGSGHAGQAVMP